MTKEGSLKVLQVISSSATSGAERHVLSLSKLLLEHGHTSEVVCPRGGWLPEALRAAGITVFESEMKGMGWFRTQGLILRRLKRGDIKVIHSHLTRATYFGAISGGLRRVPTVATVHIANHDQIYKRMARGRNRLVAVSNYVRGLLYGRGIPDRFIDTVYNGTDFFEFAPSSVDGIREELGIPSGRRLVGLVGRVCRDKGHLLMVDAMRDVVREHPKAHVVFVGRVEEQFDYELREAIRDAKIEKHTTFTGVRHDVPRLLDAFEFTTMPSHRETFGVAAIEAMARGKAVVASRVGGLQEVVQHGQTGLLVDLRPDELAEAVNYLLSNEHETRRMGVMGRRLVEEHFTLSKMVDRLLGVYARAIG